MLPVTYPVRSDDHAEHELHQRHGAVRQPDLMLPPCEDAVEEGDCRGSRKIPSPPGLDLEVRRY